MLLYSTDCLKRNSKMKNKEQHTFPFIERLLDGAEVEWKPLGEVAEIGTGSSNRKDEDENGAYPFYVRSKNILRSSTYQFNETAIIIPGEGGIGDIYHFVKGKYALHQRAYRVHLHTNELLDKFVYHFMRANFKAYIVSKSVGATATSIRKPMLENFFIPIPPIAVQEEIVDILDKFTELEAELEAELEGRKRQYEYYRNQLLSIDVLSKGKLKTDKIRIMTLGELGTFTRGSGLQKKDFTPTGVGCIHYGQIYTHYGTWTTTTLSFVSNETAHRLKHVEHGDIIITNTSENVQDVCKAVVYLGKEQIVTGGHASIFKPSKHIDGKYFAYYTQTIWFAREKRKYAKGTKVIDVSANDLAKIQIPIPPLSEQQRIVSILDKFDTLTTSISEGLPKEIELRRKQYEYYRDRLLSFKH